jgi:hypothetical protein
MNKTESQAQFVARRGELIAELFLQELGAEFVAAPTTDLGYDFFVGFAKPDGGMNLSAIDVKATEKPVSTSYALPKQLYARLAHSNVPGLLLVVDVKQNRLYHAWPNPDKLSKRANGNTIRIPVIEIDDHIKEGIRKRLAGENGTNLT